MGQSKVGARVKSASALTVDDLRGFLAAVVTTDLRRNWGFADCRLLVTALLAALVGDLADFWRLMAVGFLALIGKILRI